MPEGAELVEGSIAQIPLYNGDEEAAGGLPAVVQVLKEQIASAVELLLFTPEYNHSIPGVFKNAIDWTSRPANDIGRIFGGKPVALLGASPGGFGTILSQDAWLGVLRPWARAHGLRVDAHVFPSIHLCLRGEFSALGSRGAGNGLAMRVSAMQYRTGLSSLSGNSGLPRRCAAIDPAF